MPENERRKAELGARTRAAIITGFALLVLVALGALIAAISSAEAQHAATHSRVVRQAQAALFSTVQDAETGQRGYLLTGDPSYLVPFEDARARIPGLTSSLRALVGGDAPQERRLDALNADISRKIAELERTLMRYRSGDVAGAMSIIRTNEGRALMERLRRESADFDAAESAALDARQGAVDVLRTWLLVLIALGAAASGILAVFVVREFRRIASTLAERNAELKTEILERGRAEAQLRQAQKMEALGQLTGGLAHDFNNMLAIIVGNLDMAVRRLPPPGDRLRDMIDNALSGAQRAAGLTKRLLAFSRLQPLEPKPTDINKCVASLSEMLRSALGENIAVETVLGGGVWRAFIDSPQLESAILNLAVNARDAMPIGGRVTIETSNAFLDKRYADDHDEVEPGQYVLVAITDSGSGMPTAVMEKAFDPFFTTKRPGEGTGLGLSQVHGFVKQSRGHIKLYSELGVGTTVKLYLPRDVSGVAPVEPIHPTSLEADNARFTILVVEDDPGVRAFVVSATRDLGFAVIEADCATVALERLDANPEVDVLLTDVVMPGGSGRELADTARVKRPDLEVVYMTGYTRNAIVHNGALDAGTRLITKPFTVAELQRELSDALAEAKRTLPPGVSVQDLTEGE